MNELLAKLQKEFPGMECTVVFVRDPVTRQLFMNPVFKLPEGDKQKEFLLKQSELFQEYARGLSHFANTLHKTKFKKG